MPTRRLIVTLTVALAVACGGGASPESGISTAPTAAPTAAPAPAGAGTATATPAPAATVKPPSFADLVSQGKSAEYKVTYKVQTTAGGQTVGIEQKWYVKGKRSRFDFSTKEGSVSLFNLEGGTHVCTSVQTGDYETETSCFGMPKDQALQQNQAAALDLQIKDKPDQFDPTFEGTRQIAGQAAQCFAVKARVAGLGESRICYSAGGIPLLIASKGQGFETSLEATSFSTTVPDADFRLPATGMEGH